MKRRFAATIFASALSCHACALAAGDPGSALPGDQPVIPMPHARWLVKDGAPPNISGLAQTPDGWLWIASSTGLFRFDGVTFNRYRPPGNAQIPANIDRVGVLPDGRLWATPLFGGLLIIEGDRLLVYGREQGMPLGRVQGLAEGRDGRLWMASGMGLYLLDRKAGQWRNAGKALGVQGSVYDARFDRAGTLWVQSNWGNYAMRPGEAAFTRVAAQKMDGVLVEAPDGTVWATDPAAPGMRRLTPGADPDELAQLLARVRGQENVTIDSRGNMWIPARSGVLRIDREGKAPRLQGFTTRQGLSGENPFVAFEDREGSIWVATKSGLDQFRRSRMREIVLPRYLGEARPLAAGPGGELWIDNSYLASADAPPVPFAPPATDQTIISHLYREPRGTVWYGSFQALGTVEGLKQVPAELPKLIRTLTNQPIYAIARDADGALWMSLGPRGPWRLKDGVWAEHGGIDALKGYPTTSIVPGPDRTVWFASVDNSVAVLRDGQVRCIGPADGLDIGTVLQIVPDAAGAWISGDGGIARYDGRRARRILGEGGEPFPGATGMVVHPSGQLWLLTARGLVGIAASEWQRALDDASYRVRFARFDENDGLFGTAAALLPLPSMVATAQGELVMSTTRSVYRFDPAADAGNRVVPPVHITGIAAAGRTFADMAAAVLPAAPDNVRIDYTALSLALPQRVRFRYMLEGVDTDWQDAGNRRSAFYTRLEPGHYTFRVKAANDDGVWNEQGATMRFEIPPTFTQTGAFRIACALAILLAAFGLHRLRLRMTVRRLGRAFEARVAERERIARDLHDTLLQSVQGLILQFGRIALRTPADMPIRPLMQDALAQAAEVLEEGRDKVGELRVASGDRDLGAWLEAHGRRLAAQQPVSFVLAREGAPRRLRPAALDEALSIGREAIRNAFVHGQADRIEVVLRYGSDELELIVRDDGIGIDASVHGGREGHWGIPGMRERAAEAGATLDLVSAPGQGTTWRLRLPARLAYARQDDASHATADLPERVG